MTSLRKFFHVIFVVALTAFALPAAAANKNVSLTVPAGPLAAGAQQITITINNDGNSNANSFEIDWIPTANFSVSGGFVSGDPSNIGASKNPGVFGAPYTGLVFNKQAPAKGTVNITLNVTVSPACGQTSASFHVAAWTGSPGPLSTSFPETPPGGPYTTALAALPAGTCTISFAKMPADAFTNATITNVPFNSAGTPVQVKAMNGASPAAGVLVSVTSAACSITSSATTNASGLASFTSLTSTAAASVTGCVLSASASGYTPSPLNSDPFNVVKPDGQLGCSSTNNFAYTGYPYDPNTEGPFMGTPGIGLRRGPNTDDPSGANCVVIPFTLSIDPDNNTTSFIADKRGQKVIVEYVVVWKNSSTVNGWPPERHPQVAFGPNLHNPPLVSEYIDGLACNNDDVTASPLPVIPSVPPYSTSSISQYQPDGMKTAAMCIAQQGWTSITAGTVQFWNRIIDTDGFARNP